jgi:hypothetical protein
MQVAVFNIFKIYLLCLHPTSCESGSTMRDLRDFDHISYSHHIQLQRTFNYLLSESDVKSLSKLYNNVLLDDLVLIKKNYRWSHVARLRTLVRCVY